MLQAYVGERFLRTFCQEVDDGHGRICFLYPILSHLAIVPPVSTADCERGLFNTKSDARNRLKTDTLDRLI